MLKITLIFFISHMLIAQSWTSSSTLTNLAANATDLFTNKDGNHILAESNGIKYYLYDTQSNQLISALIDSSGKYPRIIGNNEKVVIAYIKGNLLKVKYSTNSGNSWISISDLDIGNDFCNGIDLGYDFRGAHLVWAVNDNRDDYTTYYRLFIFSQNTWSSLRTAGTGGLPSITLSSNKAHIAYNSGTGTDAGGNAGEPRTRDYNYSTNSWENEQIPYPSQFGDSKVEKIFYDGNLLHLFFLDAELALELEHEEEELLFRHWDHMVRAVNGTWQSGSETISDNGGSSSFEISYIDGFVHVVFCANSSTTSGSSLYHKKYNLNTSSWSTVSEFTQIVLSEPNLGLSVVENDLYLIYKKMNDNYISYRQYDAAPLTPSNFAGTTHNVGWNAYPKITWSAVIEPDVRENANGIKIQRSLNGASFTDLTNISGTSTSFIDYGVGYAGSGPANVRYKIQSVDLGSNTSDWTSIVQIQYGDAWKAGSNNEENFVVTEYELHQNYPNPFNPKTTIQYDVKDAGFVQLKVYDMLGNEVAVLVNELKESGRYNAEFNASQLTSGVYIYSLRVNEYFLYKKMTVLK